jgi:carbamoyltransferase
MPAIALHLNHDSTLALDLDGDFHNLELERLFGKRHFDARHERPPVAALVALVHRHRRDFDLGLHIGPIDDFALELFRRLNVADVRCVDHHLAHAAAAFYASPFGTALIVSYDGGGNDGTFRSFIGTRPGGLTPVDEGLRLNLGIPYRALAHPIREIRKPDDGKERSNAGKLMGLAAFGRVRPEWIATLRQFYLDCSAVDSFAGMYRWVVSQLEGLQQALRLPLTRDALAGADAYDLACTGQHVFERIVLDAVLPLVARHRLPLCITGGCALNVILNQHLADILDVPIFVPPNPNDCGLAQGALLLQSRPARPATVTYSGPAIDGIEHLGAMASREGAVAATPSEVARRLHAGQVVAVMRGQSEHGPRALGHRSILCDPSVPGMKDRLNERVKFREPFRPYAPVVRPDDLHTYFQNARHDLSYMSFNPTIRPEWRQRLAAAAHVDGTARVQTVTAAQNPWLFETLGEFAGLGGFGALVNTSFNTKGRPMVTHVDDAMHLLKTTDLDALVIDDWLFKRPGG